MRYYSKKILSVMAMMATISCAPARKETRTRAPNLRKVVSSPIKMSGRELSSQELIDYFFTSEKKQSACEYLYSIPKAGLNEARFRILESASVMRGSSYDGNGNLKSKDCTMACLNPINWGSIHCRLCKEESLDIVDVWGRVSVGSHPIYEIALQKVEIPNRSQFMDLVGQESSKFGIVLLPFFETYKQLLHLGLQDAISMRNKLVQEKISEAFPGAFDLSGKSAKMEDSLSLALIMNALPNYSTMLVMPYDSDSEKKRKAYVMNEMARALSRPLPYFKSSSWSDFSNDAVASLNASMRSLQTSDPVQHACAMALLHRNFAQMIRIMGYSRLPIFFNASGNTAFQVPFSRLLGSEDGTKIAVCPAPGSFVEGNSRLILNEDVLSNYSSSRTPIEMSGRIEDLRRCTRADAKVYSDADLKHVAFGKPSARATAEDNLALMRVLSHQLTAFNPGSTWWTKSAEGYPLGEFTDFDTIDKSGAVLPYQYHALALGLMQITLDTILDKHLLQVDASFKESKVDKNIIGIRMSSPQRKAGSKQLVETSIDTALLLTEIAFKAGAYLKQLPLWKRAQISFYNSELRNMGTKIEKYNFQMTNTNFVNGLFGATKNLNMLSGSELLPNGMQVQDQVDNLKVASALLLATFAQQAPGSTAENPRYTCVTKLVTDPSRGGESKVGTCSAAQEKAWKKTFAWLGQIYKSPLFAGYAK